MAKEISIIRQEAQQVQNATQVGENTAQRVGGVLVDIVDKAEEHETDIDNLNAYTGIDDYPTFSESTAYSAGDVVNYNGKLYKFTADHAAGAWTGTDIEKTDIIKANIEECSKSFITNNEYANSIIKELYLLNGFDEEKKYSLRAIAVNHSSVGYAISIRDKSEESGHWFTLQNTNGYQEVSAYTYKIGIVVDWSRGIEGNTIIDADIIDATKKIEFSPYIYSKRKFDKIEESIDNIKNSITTITDDIKVLENNDTIMYINAFNKGIKGKFINSTGGNANNDTCITTPYLQVNEGDIFYLSTEDQSTSIFAPIWGYTDTNGNGAVKLADFIKGKLINKKIVIPEGVNYIRAWSDLRRNTIPFLVKENYDTQLNGNIDCGSSNGYQFNTFISAVNYAKENANEHNIINILLHDGTYDIIEEYFGEEDYTDVSDAGIVLPDYTNIIGDDRNTVILKAEFPDNIKYNTSQHFSTLNIYGTNNILKNITVTAFNCRYAIHDQANEGDENYTIVYDNCILEHKGYNGTPYYGEADEEHNTTEYRWGSNHALGQGTHDNAHIIIKNCHLKVSAKNGCAFLTHDNKNNMTGSIIDINNTIFDSIWKAISISSMGGCYNIININNCLFKNNKNINGVISSSAAKNVFNYELYGGGNSKDIVVDIANNNNNFIIS